MIKTARLQLHTATPHLLRAAMRGSKSLSHALGVNVPRSWPPDLLDNSALEYTLDRLREHPRHEAWWMKFVILSSEEGPGTLIGVVGYKGPPTAQGTVEIGYGIVRDYQRQGYATEAAMALVRRAFADRRVKKVLAETYPTLVPSIGVLTKCGFRQVKGGSEPGVIRFSLARGVFKRRALP